MACDSLSSKHTLIECCSADAFASTAFTGNPVSVSFVDFIPCLF